MHQLLSSNRRPSTARKPRNLHFPFPSFSFSLPFSLRIVFPFPSVFFSSFLLFFPFCFCFCFSHFLIAFPFHFLLSLCTFSSFFGAHHISDQRRKFPPLFLKPNVWLSIFHLYSLFLYFLFMISSPTWLHVSHGIHFPHMANCEPFLQCQVSLSWGAKWHSLTLPCVIRQPTPRKREIPTTSESNKIRRGS